MPEYPFQIPGVISRNPEFRIVFKRPRQMSQYLVGYDAALVVTRFRPRIGKQDERASKRIFGEPLDEKPRVISIEPDILQIAIPDTRQELDHPVHKRFAADYTRARVGGSLPREMLTAAESDFQPDIFHPGSERGTRVEHISRKGVELETGQQRFDKFALPGTQPPAPATPVKYASPIRFFIRGQGDPWLRKRQLSGRRPDPSFPTKIRHQPRAPARNDHRPPTVRKSGG